MYYLCYTYNTSLSLSIHIYIYIYHIMYTHIRPHLFYVFPCVKDHHNLAQYSPLLKNTCVRQVALDKWFPLNRGVQHRRVAVPIPQPLRSRPDGPDPRRANLL